MNVSTSAITRIEGRAVVLRGSDIDTDRIMPARFLRAITFSGIEAHLFADDRAAAQAAGALHPLDGPGAAGATILLTQANFGCGSSREHAPQALLRWGFRAVVAESFSPIFAGNALTIGLVCVTASPHTIAEAMRIAEASPDNAFCVDLEHLHLGCGSTRSPVSLPESQRHAWLTGQWDATSLLLADYDDVERVEARLPYLRTTSRNA
ncbi:MAG: 3-isopropylmalate dehydratase small subunit [Acidimicrobiia bacterium]|nr:3-isopropylmalate dehydratase small subunit [Acidimicrobiia bacterium]